MRRTLELMPFSLTLFVILSVADTTIQRRWRQPLLNANRSKGQRVLAGRNGGERKKYAYATRQKRFQDDADERVITSNVLVKYTSNGMYTVERERDVLACQHDVLIR